MLFCKIKKNSAWIFYLQNLTIYFNYIFKFSDTKIFNIFRNSLLPYFISYTPDYFNEYFKLLNELSLLFYVFLIH